MHRSSHPHRWLICLALILVASQVVGQERAKRENLAGFDKKPYHFGFLLGMNSSTYMLKTDITVDSSLISLNPQSQGGFNLGIITDLHLNDYFNLRFIPTLSFGQRNLVYAYLVYDSDSNLYVSSDTRPVENTFLDFPLNLKMRSMRDNNFAAYLLAGGRYSLDLASQENADNNQANSQGQIVVRTKRHSFSYEVGAGMDFFLEYFKFGIEAKMAFGINDVLVPDPEDSIGYKYSSPIESMLSKIFQLSITFEG